MRYKLLGEEHPDTLTSLSNLAYSYGELGNYQMALDLFEKVYAIRCKVLDPTHELTLRTAQRIKDLKEKLGKL